MLGRLTLASVLIVLAIGACGSSARQRAESQARRELRSLAAVQQRECHEKTPPKIATVKCQPGGSGWDCAFSLSDGLAGTVSIRAGNPRSSWWSSAC
jgi:hypothetical protein